MVMTGGERGLSTHGANDPSRWITYSLAQRIVFRKQMQWISELERLADTVSSDE